MPKINIRKHIEKLRPHKAVEPVDHIAKKINQESSALIKLDANENPYGASSKVKSILSDSDISVYPDPNQIEVRAILEDVTKCYDYKFGVPVYALTVH